MAGESTLHALNEWNNLHLTAIWAYHGKPVMQWQQSGMTPGSTGWLIESGDVQIQMGSNRIRATAGQWVLIPRGALRFRFSDDATILSVHYIAEWLSGRPLFAYDTPLIVSARMQPALTAAGWALQRFVSQKFPDAGTKLLHRHCDLRSHLKLQTLTTRWMTAVTTVMDAFQQHPTTNKPMDRRVAEAKRMVDMQVLTEPFVERQLAKRLSVSASHLDRLFLQELGVTPRMYADKARLNVACHLLINEPDLSKQIAFRLGFEQPSHFTRWFRTHTKMTPQQYRRYFQRKAQHTSSGVATPTYAMSRREVTGPASNEKKRHKLNRGSK